ncbi:MAG TPA: hypothetical protein VF283_15695 [Bryobacteraceae bacterium]
MLDTVLALLSFSALGVLAKMADVKRARPSAINLLLYSSSLGLILLITFAQHGGMPASPLFVKAVALPFGACSAIAILALQSALRFGNISTTWLAINLSAAIPTVGSIIFYHEQLGTRKTCSLLLIVVALLLLWKDRKMSDMASENTNLSESRTQ